MFCDIIKLAILYCKRNEIDAGLIYRLRYDNWPMVKHYTIIQLGVLTKQLALISQSKSTCIKPKDFKVTQAICYMSLYNFLPAHQKMKHNLKRLSFLCT